MLMPNILKSHREILANAFCVQTTKQVDFDFAQSVSYIKLYDINGTRISSLIISYGFDNDCYIDKFVDGDWTDY